MEPVCAQREHIGQLSEPLDTYMPSVYFFFLEFLCIALGILLRVVLPSL